MFYEKFRQLCANKGKYPSSVGEELGYSRQAVSKWKNGAEPKQTTVQRFADYFGVPLSYFYDETEKGIKKEPSPASDDSVMTTAEFAVKFSRLSQNDQEKVMEYMTLLLSKN